jgi:hypothetical protein
LLYLFVFRCHRLLVSPQHRYLAIEKTHSSAALITQSAAAASAGPALSFRGQPRIDEQHQTRKVALLSQFYADLRSFHQDFELLAKQRAADPTRIRPHFIIAEPDLNTVLNRMARNLWCA